MPPLGHPGRVGQIAFCPDGRQFITACADGRARVWMLVRDTRPVDALAQWVSVFYGRQIDRSGGFTPVAPETLREMLATLRASRP